VKAAAWLIAIAAVALSGCAASSGLTAAQGDAILAELRDLKRMVAEQGGPQPEPAEAPAGKLRFRDAGSFAMGADNAPVTLVEFADYQCPFCKKFHDASLPELKTKYIDTGKVRYVVRDLPLSFHAQAMPTALASRCAGAQGKFWPVFEALFSTPTLGADTARNAAMSAGVDVPKFEQCLKDPTVKAAIEHDLSEAQRLGVDGTPGFLIATRRGDEYEGTLLLGAQPASVFAQKIDALLEAAPKAP
jgi:protein-disulfide isomerase